MSKPTIEDFKEEVNWLLSTNESDIKELITTNSVTDDMLMTKFYFSDYKSAGFENEFFTYDKLKTLDKERLIFMIMTYQITLNSLNDEMDNLKEGIYSLKGETNE